jgi:cyclopropane-fatty-acyl-phospholipid synthase
VPPSTGPSAGPSVGATSIGASGLGATIVPDEDDDILEQAPGLLATLGRKLLFRQLASLHDGELRILDGDNEWRFGARTARCALSVTIEVLHAQFYADVAFGGSVGAGSAYIRGLWRCSDLTGLVRLMVVNYELQSGLEGGMARLQRPLLKLFHWLHRNSREGSARNIAAHYDLGNGLYELMLDETMAYSCGIFATPETTLAEASRAKFEAACHKLDLKASDHLLEIGTGWGGLAMYAAERYGCQVTTTTISREQHDWARARIHERGLDGRIKLLLRDYRDLDGQYDKLVSVEMIEAVGAKYLDTYLAKCASLLKASGAMLLQAITIQDQLYRPALHGVDFIQRYVFPGSFIPSIAALTSSLTRVTDLKLFHLQDIGPHYARTLELWRHNFFAQLAKVRQLGYGEQFIRLWEFYLCYCEGGFAERQLGDVQMLLTKPDCRRPTLLGA